jgi:hypothetical protein
MGPVELRSARLRFRDFELRDYQAVHAFAADLAVVSYVEWGPNTPEETRAYLREAGASAEVVPRRRYALAVVVVHSDGERLIPSQPSPTAAEAAHPDQRRTSTASTAPRAAKRG